jgi:beta-galactosidase
MKRILVDFRSSFSGNNAVVETEIMMASPYTDGVFTNKMTYEIASDGKMKISHSIVPDGNMPSWIPRAGQQWTLNSAFNNVQWYGRGPQENYPDRNSGYRVGLYNSTVDEMYEPYLIPQDYGLRTDTRMLKVTDSEGYGIEITGNGLFNFSAHPFSEENLTRALYTYQLKKSDRITLNLDYRTSGVGCTAVSVFSDYQILPGRVSFELTVKPLAGRK